jgi:transcriptional accessory protein Tex/SPT6
MPPKPRTRRPKAEAKPTTAEFTKVPGKELAIVPKSQLDLDFERMTKEMNESFERIQAEALAALGEIEHMTDFLTLRENIETQFDMIEQAGAEELKEIKAKAPKGDPVLDASVAFAVGQEELADTVDELGQAAWEVQMLATRANQALAAVASVM